MGSASRRLGVRVPGMRSAVGAWGAEEAKRQRLGAVNSRGFLGFSRGFLGFSRGFLGVF